MPKGCPNPLPPPKNKDKAENDQTQKAVTEKQTGDEPPGIAAFISSALLHSSIYDHGNHKEDPNSPMGSDKTIGTKGDQKADQFPCTASAKRKGFAPKMKGSILSAMTAEENRQPLI